MCIATILTNVVLLFLRNRNEYYLIMVLLFIAPHKRENKCHCEWIWKVEENTKVNCDLGKSVGRFISRSTDFCYPLTKYFEMSELCNNSACFSVEIKGTSDICVTFVVYAYSKSILEVRTHEKDTADRWQRHLYMVSTKILRNCAKINLHFHPLTITFWIWLHSSSFPKSHRETIVFL